MKRVLTTVAALAAVIAIPSFAVAKIGVVDYAKVFEQVPQGQATVAKLKDELKPQVDQVTKQQQQLVAQIKDFERNGPTMSKTARDAEQKQLEGKQADFQKQVVQIHQEQLQKEHTAAMTFQTDLQNAVNKVAESGKYDLILNSQAAPYSASSYDVTSQVVTDMKSSS